MATVTVSAPAAGGNAPGGAAPVSAQNLQAVMAIINTLLLDDDGDSSGSSPGTPPVVVTPPPISGVRGTITFIHTDGLGSPVARTNASGALVSRTGYEPYGLTASGATPTMGFTAPRYTQLSKRGARSGNRTFSNFSINEKFPTVALPDLSPNDI